jgi:hypothetical protein
MRRAGAALVGLCFAWAQASAQGLVISNEADLPTRGAGAVAEQAAAARMTARRMEGRALHAVQVRGRWTAGLQLPFTPCEALSAELTFALMEAVRAAMRAPDWLGAAAGERGGVQVLYLDVDAAEAPAGSCGGRPAVDLVIRPYRVQVATERLGDNVLPLAREAFGTAFSQVPAALLALNPALAIRRDPATGTSLRLDLQVPAEAMARGLAGEAGLQQSVGGRYRDNHLALTWQRALTAGADARLRLGARSQRQPAGEGTVEQREGGYSAGITLKLAPTRRLWVDAMHQTRRDRMLDRAGGVGSEQNTSVGSARLLLDLLQAESLASVRAGLWHERGADRSRSAVLLAGAREFRWQPGQLIGIEAALVAGRADAATPEARRFHGGTPAPQWLFDSPGSPALLALPDGPVLRSAGRLQAQLGQGAAARGGTRFWSLGLSTAFPVARWYRPLIPDETTDLQLDESKPPLTLKQLLMKQVDVTGPNLLAATLAAQGVPQDEANRQAQAALAEVRPAVRYIVKDAPLLAVRPLLMLDLAGLSDGGTGAEAAARWAAVGVGAQVQMATARFEAGYMRTVSGPVSGRSRGAFVLRLTFQNLF